MVCLVLGVPMDMEGPSIDVAPGRPMGPMFEEHTRIPHRVPAPMDPQGPPVRHDGPRFEPNEPHMGRHGDDFRGPPMDLDQHSLGRPMPMDPGVPPIRFDGPNPMLVHSKPVEGIPAPRTPPRQDRGMLSNILVGSRDGAVVRAHASHQCGLGLISLLRGFFSWYSGFPPSTKTNISKFQFELETVERKATP